MTANANANADAAAKLVEFMARAIVEKPDEIRVTVTGDDGDVLELQADGDDRGRVIGRQGRVAKAMRAVVEASSVGSGFRLEIID